LLHPIHDGVSIIDLTHPVDETAIEENSFGRRRFPGIYMGHYTDISNFVERKCFVHTR
jgi:hypothetical protein